MRQFRVGNTNIEVYDDDCTSTTEIAEEVLQRCAFAICQYELKEQI